MRDYTVTVILGTRPEAIKLAPVILEMQRAESRLQPVVCYGPAPSYARPGVDLV